MKNRYLGALALLAACAGDRVNSAPENDKPQEVLIVEPREPCPDFAPDQCGDLCTDFQFDSEHCGSCATVCDPRLANNGVGVGFCYNGDCVCDDAEDDRLPIPACREHQICHRGMCLVPDPKGAICDPAEGIICEGSNVECVGGKCTFINCMEEICDGFDNDCDGVVDEATDTAVTCYDGSPETLGVGRCRNGISICTWTEFGKEYGECLLQVVPVPETGLLACDGVDNDCDGCVDGVAAAGDECGPAIPREFDVVFMIDLSGSMSPIIDAVRQAVQQFSEQFRGDDNFHFGLVIFPADPTSDVVGLEQDLDEYTVFENSISFLRDNGGSEEGNWDAVYLVATGGLPMSFRADAQRIYILFTDEPGQSYLTPQINERIMCQSVQPEAIFAAVVGTIYRNLDDDFDCNFSGVNPTLLFALTSDVREMIDNLNSIFSAPCE